MGIFERLGTVINSYMNDFGSQTNRGFYSNQGRKSGDPDLDAAYDELNDFLSGNTDNRRSGSSDNNYFWKSQGDRQPETLPPEEILADYKFLGLPHDADDETCKAQYKKLLKIHHPDRHAGHEANYKKATEMSAKINAAWDRIEKYRKTQSRKNNG